MKRKIYDKLLEWKQNSNGKTAILIDGARRVGKSYIVEKFARENYKSFILIDFNKVSNDVKDLFEHYLNDMDKLILVHYLHSCFPNELITAISLLISFNRCRFSWAISYILFQLVSSLFLVRLSRVNSIRS